mgnify:CR=1 FL=1
MISDLQKKFGESICNRYIVSNCCSAKDIASVFFLAKGTAFNKEVSIDFIPLFESVQDLENAEAILEELFTDKTYLKHFKITLSAKNCHSIFIPKGFAHGFLGLDKENLIVYQLTDYRSKKDELGIKWNDKDLKIRWPVKKPIVSKKDSQNITLKDYLKKQ